MNKLLTSKHINFYDNFNKNDISLVDDNLFIGNENIVNINQQEIMQEYAKVITSNKTNRVLEIGYGLGIFSNELLKYNIGEYVIIEAHPKLCNIARQNNINSDNILIIEGLWQDNIYNIGMFDAIFYDATCPDGEAVNDLIKFIDIAFNKLLNEKGIFSFWYCSNKIHSKIYNCLKSNSSKLEVSIFEPNYVNNWKFKNKNFIIFKAIK
jgi:spermidine synthase